MVYLHSERARRTPRLFDGVGVEGSIVNFRVHRRGVRVAGLP